MKSKKEHSFHCQLNFDKTTPEAFRQNRKRKHKTVLFIHACDAFSTLRIDAEK
jgi:hypothetical protein